MSEKKHQDDQNNEDDIVFEEEELGDARSVKSVREKLKKCVGEKQEYLDGWQRAKADLVNLKREMAERQSAGVAMARGQLIENLLPILDSFDMAFRGEAWSMVDANWRKGVEYIHTQFVSVLKGYGVEVENPEGEIFDPSRHEPVEIVETLDETQDGIIVAVLQPGYLYGENVLRPAKVKVAQLKV